jgi:hypothetical protein
MNDENLEKELTVVFMADTDLQEHEKKAITATDRYRDDMAIKKQLLLEKSDSKKDDIVYEKTSIFKEPEQEENKEIKKKALKKIAKPIVPTLENESEEISSFDELAQKLPLAHREKFWKILHKHGIREDDYLAALLEVTGFVNTVYKTVPESNKKLAESIKRITELYIEQVTNEREKTRIQMQEISKTFIEEIKREQALVSIEFKTSAETYLNIIAKANKQSTSIIDGQKERIKELLAESLHQTFPKLAEKYMGELVDTAKDSGFKKFMWNAGHSVLLITLAVLSADTIRGIVEKIFN